MAKPWVAVVLAASVLAPSPRAAGGPELDAPVLSGMRAQLFEQKSGSLSENILSPSFKGWRNSMTGPRAASSTLVVVELTGPPRATFTGMRGRETKYLVTLRAHETGSSEKVLLDASEVVPVFGENGKAYVAFLFRHSGCAPVALTAQLNGKKPGKPLVRSLSFACGE
jgi:hypothetical protein